MPSIEVVWIDLRRREVMFLLLEVRALSPMILVLAVVVVPNVLLNKEEVEET